MEYKESKHGLCDLIRSRLNNRNYLVNRDNAFRDFGLYASQLLDTMEGPFALPELKMLNAFKNNILEDFNMSHKDLDTFAFNELGESRSFKKWVNGELVADKEVITWEDNIPEKFITEDDIIFMIYFSSVSELKKQFREIMIEEEKVDKDILNKFLNEEDISLNETKIIIKAFNHAFNPNYKRMAKRLFPNKDYIFVPINDFNVDL